MGCVIGAVERRSIEVVSRLESCGSRETNLPFATRKLACRPSISCDTNSFPVRRHHAGRSSRTEISLDLISRSWPGASGSIWRRISSNNPLPQSRSPPSKLASGAYGWRQGCVDSSITPSPDQYETQGAPPARNSTSFAPPTILAPATRLFSSSPRFLKHGEHT